MPEETEELFIRPCLYKDSLSVARKLETNENAKIVSILPTTFQSRKTEAGPVVIEISRVAIYYRQDVLPPEPEHQSLPLEEEPDPFADP